MSFSTEEEPCELKDTRTNRYKLALNDLFPDVTLS